MNQLRVILIILMLAGTLLSSFMVFRIETEKGEVKDDLVELSMAKYGLFNVDEWKLAISEIIRKKIDELEITEESREAVRQKVRSLLTEILDDFEQSYYEDNANSVKGWLKNGVATVTGTFKKLREEVPEITDTIVRFLEEEKNREAITKYLVTKLDEYEESTFSETDYRLYNKILADYGAESKDDAVETMEASIEELQASSILWKVILSLCMLFSAVILWFSKFFTTLEYIFLTCLSLVFLTLGVTLPMIEIDARISHLGFRLLGETLSFDNQILYFKSKSILEVVRLMLSQGKPELILVGVLALLFSVIFPVSKLLATFLFLSERQSGRKLVNFLVFKTSKWSMADVLVVAIFMAYLGFDGIVTEQLGQVEQVFQDIEILTTNMSQLLFGFFAFLAFVLLSLLTSQRLNARMKEKPGF